MAHAIGIGREVGTRWIGDLPHVGQITNGKMKIEHEIAGVSRCRYG